MDRQFYKSRDIVIKGSENNFCLKLRRPTNLLNGTTFIDNIEADLWAHVGPRRRLQVVFL